MESEIGPEGSEAGFAPVDSGLHGEPSPLPAQPAPDASAVPPMPAAPPLPPGPPAPPGPPGPPASQPYPTQTWPAPGPMPPYGYAPYGYGYGYPQPPAGTNGMAIAAMVLGICGFLVLTPIVGLVLGLVALAAVRRSGQRGKGFAISGIVLSGAWIALFATLIVVAVVTEPEPARRDASGAVVAKGVVSIYDLRPRDCLTIPPSLIGSTDAKTSRLTVVPCSAPHDSEVFGSYKPAASSYPGLDAIRTESQAQCYKLLSPYLLDIQSLPSGSLVQFIYPNGQAWDHGEHSVSCFLQFPSATVTQSVQRAASAYNADQLRYLNAVHPLIDALDMLNATPKSADLSLLDQRAADIATACQNEVRALTSSPWPTAAQADIDALAAGEQAAATLWGQAAGATDVTTFGGLARQADAAFDSADTRAVRADLGLTTMGGGSRSPSGSDSSGGAGGQTA